MKMREIINIVENKHALRYRARWNPDNMWFDIVDMNNRTVVKDVSPNERRAKEIASQYYPGMVIERAKPSTIIPSNK